MIKSLLNEGTKDLDLQTGHHLRRITSYAIVSAQNDTIKGNMLLRNTMSDLIELVYRKRNLMISYYGGLIKIDKSHEHGPELHRTCKGIIMSEQVV